MILSTIFDIEHKIDTGRKFPGSDLGPFLNKGVIDRTSVALSAHQRTPSPEYWTSFPISPVPRSNHPHRCSQFSSPYRLPSDSHSLRSLVLPRLTFPSVYSLLLILRVLTCDCSSTPVSLSAACPDLLPVTVYDSGYCRLPRPLPGIVYVFGFPSLLSTLYSDHCLFDHS